MTDSDSRSTPGDLPHESHNARRFVIANGVQNLGDQLVAAKTVLPVPSRRRTRGPDSTVGSYP